MDEIGIDLDALSASNVAAAIPSSAARLAPWQVKLAKKGMARQLATGLRIADIAANLDISVTHFSKGFRNSVGIAPYRWFMNARLAHALHLLAETRTSMAEIATACGYSCQSHFTTSFSNAMGTTPTQWRRRRRENATGPLIGVPILTIPEM
ncbi:MAG: AraC family transcriptional regulator [Sphingomonadales bacterium]|jgi:AraC family transcriptional regulator|nr:MAG: AraC family transcriptional regulator [Alphaproteobacteria bacterium]TNF05208.1 MAG: AraC family transcriptional regulator [Sphingomonadales bacterium]